MARESRQLPWEQIALVFTLLKLLYARLRTKYILFGGVSECISLTDGFSVRKIFLGKVILHHIQMGERVRKMIIQKSIREKKDILFNMVEYILQEVRKLLYIFLKISSCI